jgi:phage tail sheath protein FI
MASVLRAARRVGEGLLFEPNGPRLWARLKRSVEDLLTDYWREGGLRGASTAEAFDVRCDRSTMSQNDIDNGRVIAQIGVAPAAAVERMVVVLALDAGGAAVELREVA